MINNESFYYLENGDLTSEGLKSGIDGKGYQSKFQFNKGLLEYFSWKKFHNFSNIIISGYIEILTEMINKDNTLNCCLISKRSNQRIGIRLIERGMDLLGNCSNTIETEQIIHYKDKKYSFATIRGHVPLFWYQNNFEVINSIQLIQNNESKMFSAFEKHIQKIYKNGKQLILINLLKDNGNEKILSAKYQDYCNKKELSYFHLRNHIEIKNYIEELNSYSLNELLNLNFRLNCKSCIDRTNGFQYQLNQLVLKKIIQHSNNNNNNSNLIVFSSFYKKYQQCWINNGNNLSRLYNDTNCIKKYMTSSPQDNNIIELVWISIKRKFYSYFYHGYKFDGYQFYFINNLNNNNNSNNNNNQQQYQKYNFTQLFNFNLFNFTIYLLLTILNYTYRNNNSIVNIFLSIAYTLTLFLKKPITSVFIDKSNDN
ncbi:hypothetical protein K502DRAFT_325140 [Neoconidiobolus thromboides FSU 785]|nr:hypothetical protein K502DRAFT_325140 [Neoconidiobolus thromboides FSU 785]